MSREILSDAEAKMDEPIEPDLWIHLSGGFGETLMLSGVLKLAWDGNPRRRFNLVKRTPFNSFFRKHPAIAGIGSPPLDARVLEITGKAPEGAEGPERRPYQVMARQFGLSVPIEEHLFLPGELRDDDILRRFIDWGAKRVAVIAPASDSPRKTPHPLHWQYLVDKLTQEGAIVIQVGRMNEIYIRGAYSLLGLLTNEELAMLVKKSAVVIAVDNPLIPLAHMVRTPAVALWGPTDPDIRGYGNQVNLRGPRDHCPMKDDCPGKDHPANGPKACPLNAEHCLDKIPVDFILLSAINILKEAGRGDIRP
jgi:ADP-heptose:LPS heptosyltransferase